MLKKITRRKLIRVGLGIGGAILLAGALFLGIFVQARLLSPNSATQKMAGNTDLKATTAKSVPEQLAQDMFVKFANFLKGSSNNTAIRLTDYKVAGIGSSTQKDSEAHVIILFSALPADTDSLQALLAAGGALQKNGWVTAKAYIVLIKQNGTFTLRAIGFSPFPNF